MASLRDDGKPQTPGQWYRSYLRRGVTALMEPQHEALLCGEPISSLAMEDLEALFELVFGSFPRRPVGYRDRHSALA